ncbi:MAG TPA: 16S rRNA (cytidine(1402)-2'-O)-methyltransferase [Alphaproteobacteria bacterium]|nr:16S rRNA (cytidine(1402)-2'-O)-methyltransferase [Alphaproteobacteria bacterium]
MTGRRHQKRGVSKGSFAGSRPRSGNRPEPNHRDARSKPASLDAGLYIVATPIGNARDITLRALAVLGAAAVIACEDTRTTAKLLAIHCIQTKLTPYHEHNAPRARPALIRRLKKGETVALVSDAGTPLVSDPGYRLVGEAVAAGIAVFPLPGASAVLAALAVSNLPTDRFFFQGFLPNRTAARRKVLAEIGSVPATLVIMESPKRLVASLADMACVLGDRQAAVARELTKKFEEVRRGALAELAAYYEDQGAPRGEVVVVVAPGDRGEAADVSDDELDVRLGAALSEMSLRDAAAIVSNETGTPRKKVYARALDLRREK